MDSKDYLPVPEINRVEDITETKVGKVYVNKGKTLASTTPYDLKYGTLDRYLRLIKLKPLKDVFLDTIHYTYCADSFNNVFRVVRYSRDSIYFKAVGTNSKGNKLIHTAPELYSFKGLRKNTKAYKDLQQQCKEKAKECLAVLSMYSADVVDDAIIAAHRYPNKASALVEVVQLLVEVLNAKSRYPVTYNTLDTYSTLVAQLNEKKVSEYLIALEVESTSDCTVRLKCTTGSVVSDILIEDKE